MGATKPIGYWLKHLDNLLERQFEATLADLGINRRHWQVLHRLSDGACTRDELTEALAPFWAEAEPELDAVLGGLAARGWTRRDHDPVALTDQGLTAHREIAARIAQTRATVADGLSREQYAETVRVLARMAANVEAALRAR